MEWLPPPRAADSAEPQPGDRWSRARRSTVRIVPVTTVVRRPEEMPITRVVRVCINDSGIPTLPRAFGIQLPESSLR